jgi:hypothetical protein
VVEGAQAGVVHVGGGLTMAASEEKLQGSAISVEEWGTGKKVRMEQWCSSLQQRELVSWRWRG